MIQDFKRVRKLLIIVIKYKFVKAELFNFRCWVDEASTSKLKNNLNQILIDIDFELLGFVEHHFTPQGYTAVWLLGESHLAIHTYPEHGKTYIELTSCSKEKNNLFEQQIQDNFQGIEKL